MEQGSGEPHDGENITTLSDYEYVVVGSGAGGGPLAAKLAGAGHSVLLIEAGDDQGANLNLQVPAFHARSTEDESMRWDYFVNHYGDDTRARRDSKMVWEKADGSVYVGKDPPAGSRQKGILYPRAGTLGGCSSHHALITVYPHESDWDHIAELTGDRSWEAKNMRKYFERLERCEYNPGNRAGHGFDGWLGVDRADPGLILEDIKVLEIIKGAANAATDNAVEEAAQLAAILLADLNAADAGRDNREGIYQLPLSMSKGCRNGPRDLLVATANATNADGSKKYRLDIRTRCLATKVLFAEDAGEGKAPKAIGIEFFDGDSIYEADPRSNSASEGTKGRVLVSREVILAAGAFSTPQLLTLSGIGPKEELGKHNIKSMVELPGVGRNLQDRYEVAVVSKLQSDFQVIKKCTFGKPGDPCLADWEHKRGPYLSNGLTVAMVKKSSIAEQDPDLFIFGGPAFFEGYYPGYSERAVSDKDHFTWTILKAHTRNRGGTVRLRSTDPRQTPAINFEYFDTGSPGGRAAELDLQAIFEGIAFARQISDDVPDIPFLPDGIEEEVPGRRVATDEGIKDFIKNEAWGHHASCTCPIGPDGDLNAVLDSRFRVRGVRSLRVVDASVFPRIPGFFLILPIFMISEKASDVILEDIGNS